MSDTTQTISPENVLSVNILGIALNENFGNLKFENANKKLSAIQSWLTEAKELGFSDLLLPSQVSALQNYTSQLVEKLQWLNGFDLTVSANPKAEHDTFENQVDSFYNDVYENLRMKYLPFLREEKRRENPDERALDEEVRKASQLRSDLENELKSVRADIDQIKSTRQEVGAAKGERGATKLALHFGAEASLYQGAADTWFWFVVWGYGAIVAGIVIVAIYYTWFGNWSDISWQSAVAKGIFFASLWYGLSFLIRNYNINSHLAAVNRHRTAVASTLEDFIESNPPQQEAMLKNATEAMFKNAPIGFVTKVEKDSGNPMFEIVNKVIGAKGGE